MGHVYAFCIAKRLLCLNDEKTMEYIEEFGDPLHLITTLPEYQAERLLILEYQTVLKLKEIKSAIRAKQLTIEGILNLDVSRITALTVQHYQCLNDEKVIEYIGEFGYSWDFILGVNGRKQSERLTQPGYQAVLGRGEVKFAIRAKKLTIEGILNLDVSKDYSLDCSALSMLK